LKKDGIIYLQIEPKLINDLNHIFEGYEHVAMVSTVDNVNGIVKLWGTPDTQADMETIIVNLPFSAKKLTDYQE
jgi:hypothetical protein